MHRFLSYWAAAILIASLNVHLNLAVAQAAAIQSTTTPVGTFRGGRSTYEIAADGTFAWQGDYFGSGDAGMVVKLKGKIEPQGTHFIATADRNSIAEYFAKGLPADFPISDRTEMYLRSIPPHLYLLTETDLISIANQVNASGDPNVDATYLTRKATSAQPFDKLTLPAESLLRASHDHLLLESPLNSRIVEIGEISQSTVNIAGWMRPEQLVPMYTATVTIDAGQQQGVFEGMRLYVGTRKVQTQVVSVRAQEADVRYSWQQGGEPHTGTTVTSTQLQAQ